MRIEAVDDAVRKDRDASVDRWRAGGRDRARGGREDDPGCGAEEGGGLRPGRHFVAEYSPLPLSPADPETIDFAAVMQAVLGAPRRGQPMTAA